MTAAAVVAVAAGGWLAEHRALQHDHVALTLLETRIEAANSAAAENVRLRQREADVARTALASRAGLDELRRKTEAAQQQLTALHMQAAKGRASVQPPAAYAGSVYDIAALDTPPQPTLRVPPSYPAELRKQGVAGKAVVEFVIGPDGNVLGAHAISATHPDFAAAAVTGVSRWQFAPGKLHGVPVGARMQIPISFTLENPGKATPPSATSASKAGPANWF